MIGVLLFSVLAGFLGAILGLGGGVIVVPFLTLVYHVDIRQAIAASLISVVATSSAAAVTFLKENLTNVRIGIFLQVATVIGALVGVYISPLINAQKLFIVFGIFLAISALLMLRKRHSQVLKNSHPLALKLGLSTDQYHVDRPVHGFVWMFFAGAFSSLLGIGSGSLKVLAMDNYMKLPIKVSTATSNFMIGMTASVGSLAYLLQGKINPLLVAPVAIGITIGSYFGAKALPKLPDQTIRYLFVVVIFIIAGQMILKGMA